MARAEYRLAGRGRRSLRELAGFRDRFGGRRCVILGNGPSLREMDLSPLRNEITFGLNRAYLMYERLGFTTTFLVAVNDLVIEQCGDEIVKAGPTPFLGWRARRFLSPEVNPIYLRSDPRPGFYRDVRRGVWEGATVTYVALQLAYHMGFTDVTLVGVDHSFATKGTPHAEVISAGDDPNHFDPNYFGAGFRWNLPDLETSEIAYRLARSAYEADGRRIVDATVGGHLDVFDKADYRLLVERWAKP
jgi:hypothetical protein